MATIVYTGKKDINITVSNLYFPPTDNITNGLTWKITYSTVNGLLDDGNNNTSDDFSYYTNAENSTIQKAFHTVQNLPSTNSYTWTNVICTPVYSEKQYASNTIEVRQAVCDFAYDYTNNKLIVTALPTNAYTKTFIAKQNDVELTGNMLQNNVMEFSNIKSDDITLISDDGQCNKKISIETEPTETPSSTNAASI